MVFLLLLVIYPSKKTAAVSQHGLYETHYNKGGTSKIIAALEENRQLQSHDLSSEDMSRVNLQCGRLTFTFLLLQTSRL